MNELKKIWDDMQEADKFIKRNNLTVSEFREIEIICNSLAHGQTDTTISEGIKNFFLKYNFGVFAEGIGWRIKLKKQLSATKRNGARCRD